ncbi:hypothetical protein LJK88_39090 [Paenibacillus sp. P26]|nr:hypothetical protein LJK88_39090 [Paenibacillus sp. P26]
MLKVSTAKTKNKKNRLRALAILAVAAAIAAGLLRAGGQGRSRGPISIWRTDR